MQHPWFRGSLLETSLEPMLPMRDMVHTCPLTSKTDIDMDVFKSMTSLGCFKDKQALLAALLNPEYGVILLGSAAMNSLSLSLSLLSLRHNEEKIIYFLLLERKEKYPSVEDEARASLDDQRGNCARTFLSALFFLIFFLLPSSSLSSSPP